MPLLVDHQRSEAWLSARLGRVTASLAAACLGWDEYCSARKAWRIIVGVEPVQLENRHMQRGVLFEASARLDYEATTGNLVEETGFWVGPGALDWLGASPDGLIGEDGCLECKCPLNAPKALPLRHRAQCLVTLAVTGRKWEDYWSWPAPPQKPFLCRVYRSGLPGLVRRLEAFYRAYVVPGIEPPRKKPKRTNRAVHAHD